MGDSDELQFRIRLPAISEHTQEPLFLLSFFTFLITVIRPVLGDGSLSGLLYIASLILGLLALYFVRIYFKSGTKNYWFAGVPLLIFIVTLFLWNAARFGDSIRRDSIVLSMIFGVTVLFYALAMHKVIKLGVAIILTLFVSTLLLHTLTAMSPYLSALDPYWYYKWSEYIYENGNFPDHDYMTYPLHMGIERHDPSIEPGLDMSWVPLLLPLLLSSLAQVTSIVGVSLYDVAMLYAGVISAFTVVVVYLLMRELFSDMDPYNRVAGIIAATMLMFSPAFAQKAVAGNSEDDALGMFLFVTSLFLMFWALRKRSLKFGLMAGFSFLLLKMTWGGYVYAVIISGIFGVFYALANFMNRRNCVEHMSYIIMAIFPSLLSPLILHKQGSLPSLSQFIPSNLVAISVVGALVFSVFLEVTRRRKYGEIKIDGKEGMDRVDAWVQGNIMLIAGAILLVGGITLLYIGPHDVVSEIFETIKAAKAQDVIRKTIAEQNPTASSLKDFVTSSGPNKFGIAILYGLGMIPILLYIGFYKRSAGAIFVLAWSLPMIWGVYNKSAYLFTASVPIAALGSTIGLFSVIKKKDLESVRVIGTILIIVIPLSYIPFFGAGSSGSPNFGFYTKFVGTTPMYMGVGSDRIFWDSSLVWLGQETEKNEAVLTWWDYGHWITSTSRRPVLIDNLQADAYQIQDIAQFFVNKTTEEEAYETVKRYQEAYRSVTQVFPEGVDLRYVAIDWTMIGKGSALHFIATGIIENQTEGSFKNYAHCQFLPQASDPSPRISTNEKGEITYTQRLVFGCIPAWIQGVVFDIIKEGDDTSLGISVVDLSGRLIPWSSWLEDNDASILGVEPFSRIISCAQNFQRLPQNSICTHPPYSNLIYVPEEFSDFMMTRLYLGDYLEEYKQYGLYNREIVPLKHFELVDEFNEVEDYPGEQDYSTFGFVRVYRIVD